MYCTLSAPSPAAGHHQPTPPPETPGHSWTSLGQSLMGSLILSPGSWWAQSFVCVLQESVSPVLCKIWWLYGGVIVTSSKRSYAISKSAAPRAPALRKATVDPYLCRRHTNTQRQVWLSLSGFSWCAWGFIWALQASLRSMEFDSKSNFTPPTVLLGLFLCPQTWDIYFWWDPTFSCRQLFSSKLLILEFLQEKLSACSSTPPSWIYITQHSEN